MPIQDEAIRPVGIRFFSEDEEMVGIRFSTPIKLRRDKHPILIRLEMISAKKK